MVEEGLLWRPTASGRWERDIDEVEQFYTTLARRFAGTGRAFFALTAHVSLYIVRDSEDVELRVIDALRKAWVCLRYDHPTIASWVEYNQEARRCKKIYEEFLKTDTIPHMKAWLDDTFRQVTDSQSGEEWCNSDPPVPKLPTLFIVKRREAPDHALILDVILRSQHNIIDGIGALHLMGNLIRYAARVFNEPNTFAIPDFGDEWKHLSPPLRVAAGIPNALPPEKQARFRQIVEFNTMMRKEAEISTIPFRFGRSLPGRHQRIAFAISPEVSSRILLACKKINASLTHVYHASIAMTMRDLQERRSKKRSVRYISYSMMNERRHCKEPFHTPLHAAAVYHSVSGQSMAIDLEVPDASSNSPSEGEIREEMRRVLATPEYLIGNEDPPVPAPNPTPSASISSLGVIDNLIPSQLGPFGVENPWVTGEELGTGLGVFLGTFRGRMCLSAAYNDAWHDKAEVMNFVEKCHTLVLTCLMIYRG
ncbi:hypothetical protein N7509_013002 [Penicillium cosmopolitanum]|uniref:Uncharacterized protein n=1 Tax=Penicillium cosmopolitanum TaxID=1131564 RepID=A0A9W9SCJ4_9EURO|nr:uncharacterized protein N7509_013002 [Penicillium cosmopolitanum]KAJ5376116.1 hypothetical protein N7509_013002 [Penicillium cosmopolitanum]